jgi:hypothetical protein
MNPGTPSFPTRRSAIVRNLIFAAVAVLWLAAMQAVHQIGNIHISADEARIPAVFSDAFEPNLRMAVSAVMPGVSLTGEATRVTTYPYEGRAVVRERAHASGTFLGQPVSLRFEIATKWDNPAGFNSAHITLVPEIAGIMDDPIRATATRTGDIIMIYYDTMLASGHKTHPMRIPEGGELSSGIMDPARVRPVSLGARWQLQSVGLSGEPTVCEVEVVEQLQLEVDGRFLTAFRTVTKVETATGRFTELNTWFDRSGRALKQEVPLGPLTIVLERLERFVPSDEDLADDDRPLPHSPTADAPATEESK